MKIVQVELWIVHDYCTVIAPHIRFDCLLAEATALVTVHVGFGNCWAAMLSAFRPLFCSTSGGVFGVFYCVFFPSRHSTSLRSLPRRR